jgi:hypothetical protein
MSGSGDKRLFLYPLGRRLRRLRQGRPDDRQSPVIFRLVQRPGQSVDSGHVGRRVHFDVTTARDATAILHRFRG